MRDLARSWAECQFGFAVGAECLDERTTGMETAPRRRVDRVGRIAGQRRGLGAPVGVHRRHRRQQRLGIRVAGPLVDVVDGADFDDLSEIHDQHAVGDILHHIQIMGDEDIRESQLPLQIQEQVENLRLDRFVERGNRFIEDQQPGLQGQGTGDIHPLALSAGKLMRVAADELSRIQSHLAQNVVGARARPVRRGAVDLGTEGDGVLDRKPGIERGIGILEHHLHLPAQLPEIQAVAAADGLPVEGNSAGVGADQMHQESRGGRLAAARLADDSQHLARTDRKTDVVDRLNLRHGTVQDAAVDGKIFTQTVDHQKITQRRGRGLGGAGLGGIHDVRLIAGRPSRCAVHRSAN